MFILQSIQILEMGKCFAIEKEKKINRDMHLCLITFACVNTLITFINH